MAIRTPAAGHGKEQRLGRIRKSATDLPKVLPILLCASAGMRIATPVCALARNDMLKEGRARGSKGVWCEGMRAAAPVPCNRRGVAVFSMSLRGAKRRGNPLLLQQHIAESCA